MSFAAVNFALRQYKRFCALGSFCDAARPCCGPQEKPFVINLRSDPPDILFALLEQIFRDYRPHLGA